MTSTNDPEYMKQYWKTYDRKQVKVLFAPAEYDRLKASANGKPLAGLVRRLALERLAQAPTVPALNEATAKEALRLIRTMANNLNQVAHQVNASRLEAGPGYQPSEKMLAEMRDSLVAMQQQVAGLLTPSQDLP